MSLDITFYHVVARTSRDWGRDQHVGYYQNESVARKAAAVVKGTFMSMPGGIDVYVRPCADEVIETKTGLRVKKIQDGCIKPIQTGTYLTKQEEDRLGKLNFKFAKIEKMKEYKWEF